MQTSFALKNIWQHVFIQCMWALLAALFRIHDNAALERCSDALCKSILFECIYLFFFLIFYLVLRFRRTIWKLWFEIWLMWPSIDWFPWENVSMHDEFRRNRLKISFIMFILNLYYILCSLIESTCRLEQYVYINKHFWSVLLGNSQLISEMQQMFCVPCHSFEHLFREFAAHSA